MEQPRRRRWLTRSWKWRRWWITGGNYDLWLRDPDDHPIMATALARAYSLLVVILILIQGLLLVALEAARITSGTAQLPVPVLRWYRRFKWLNWLRIAFFPTVLWLKAWLMGVPLHSILSNTDSWADLLIILGAILEQINYYCVQLMYDHSSDWRYLRTHGRLLPGNISKALAVFPT